MGADEWPREWGGVDRRAFDCASALSRPRAVKGAASGKAPPLIPSRGGLDRGCADVGRCREGSGDTCGGDRLRASSPVTAPLSPPRHPRQPTQPAQATRLHTTTLFASTQTAHRRIRRCSSRRTPLHATHRCLTGPAVENDCLPPTACPLETLVGDLASKAPAFGGKASTNRNKLTVVAASGLWSAAHAIGR